MNFAWVVLDVVATLWPWPASSTYAFSEAAGMLLKNGIACWLTGAMLSFCAPTIMVGSLSPLKLVVELFHGMSGSAACSVESPAAVISVPPPPIEWPETARRLLSMRLATGLLEPVRKVSAAFCWVDRADTMSKRELVLITNTTNPCDAIRDPTQV